MSDLYKIVLTSSLTISGSFLVYVFGQIFSKFILEPIHEQKKQIAEINDLLVFYANKFGIYDHRTDEGEKIMSDIRALATKLISKTKVIPMYKVLAGLCIVLPMRDINIVHSSIIELSNSVYVGYGYNAKRVRELRERIASSLGIYLG